ncbi:MAG: hypothetical protein FD165_987 [Gammaproteobacteria bacterium]|nr:MAG: hypothetical protein FD165_987 [Gammaproteobacteria bacterium]TND06305.1 MAG: hypothetical protein FD120_792 [Gammaproteobacteria bacterium]
MLVAFLPMPAAHASGAPGPVSAASNALVSQAVADGFPLRFERNDGQVSAQVRYLARGRGYTLFLARDEVVWSLAGDADPATNQSASVRLRFVGADPAPPVEGRGLQPEKRNYLTGSHPDAWHTGVPVFDTVVYRALYPGINLVFHGEGNAAEYDFVVNPGARTDAIRLQFDGATVAIDERGNLVLRSAGRTLVQHAPVVYQNIAGARVSVDGRFVLKARNQVGFDIASYDVAYPLIIDPVISYATVYGGSGVDVGRGIAVNATGIYITGETDSIDFPTSTGTTQALHAGNKDVFVLKLNPGGSRVYATYLGGSGDDVGNGIAIDSAGNAFVTGDTTSSNFPLASPRDGVCGSGSGCDGGLSDAFVAKLNTAGNALVFSTYHGGSSADSGAAIAVDGTGNAYVGGETASGGFPTASPFQGAIGGAKDGFVSKFSSTGVLTYSTFLGGAGDDSVTGVAVDGSGNAYVTGATFSGDFPKTAGAYQEFPAGAGDAFVTKLGSAGSSLVYSTYLGGINFDRSYAITVDGSGNAYVTGATISLDFPTLNPAQATHATSGITRDAFVTKLNATGTALSYSTFLGGAGIDIGNAIAVDASGNAFVAGQTVSPGFPLKNVMQGYLLGDSDAFVVNLSSSGALVYSTFLGGPGSDTAFGIALDAANVAHVVGQTLRSDATPAPDSQIADTYAGSDLLKFPSVTAIQASLRGTSDAFVVRIAPTQSADLAVTKTDNATSSVIAGQPYTSTVTVTNRGPNTADEIMLVDTYPVSFDEPLSLTVNSAVPSQGTCTLVQRVVVCELGVLAGNASASVLLTYVPAGAASYTRAALIASASESDPVLTNNLASITTRVVSAGGGGGGVFAPGWLMVVTLAGLFAMGFRLRSGRPQG